MKIKVGIVGYGTIGKRVAWAVSKQPDMEVSGVVKTRPNWEVYSAIKKGYPIYTLKKSVEAFRKKGIDVSGTFEDLLKEVDVIVDATPAGTGTKNKDLYSKYGVKQVFQGGEPVGLCKVSFNALVNYDRALSNECVRVVSCNTTGLVRALHALSKVSRLLSVRAVIVRRGADLKEIKKGPIEGLVLKPTTPPSHHAIDVKAVLGDLDIMTYAIVAPTTLAHMHVIRAELANNVSKEDIMQAFKTTPRIVLVNGDILSSTAELREFSKDFIREEGDIYENVIWEDSVWVNGNEVMFVYAVHQEAVVVPENIDAIRALAGLITEPEESIKITDKVLGIGGWFE